MSIDDVEDVGNMLIVKIPTSKTNKPRCFIIGTETRDMKNMVEIYRKYVSLRSPATAHNRLFVSYNNGKCSVQPIGINTFGKIPSQIASYLKLLNPHEYTGHSFRRSSTTILADAGADVLELKDMVVGSHQRWQNLTWKNPFNIRSRYQIKFWAEVQLRRWQHLTWKNPFNTRSRYQIKFWVEVQLKKQTQAMLLPIYFLLHQEVTRFLKFLLKIVLIVK